MCTIQGWKARGTNDMIKTYPICSKNYVIHNGEWETLGNHGFERLKYDSGCQDLDKLL